MGELLSSTFTQDQHKALKPNTKSLSTDRNVGVISCQIKKGCHCLFFQKTFCTGFQNHFQFS